MAVKSRPKSAKIKKGRPRNMRLYVVGSPGCGKTTLLRIVAQHLIECGFEIGANYDKDELWISRPPSELESVLDHVFDQPT